MNCRTHKLEKKVTKDEHHERQYSDFYFSVFYSLSVRTIALVSKINSQKRLQRLYLLIVYKKKQTHLTVQRIVSQLPNGSPKP